MSFDYTSYLSFLQVAVGMNFSFILMDKWHLLNQLKTGLINVFDLRSEPLLGAAEDICKKTRKDIDVDWINHKGRVRKYLRKYLSREPYDNKDYLYLSRLAVICCLFSAALLFLLALMADKHSLFVTNVTLVISELNIAAILYSIYKIIIIKNHDVKEITSSFFIFVLTIIVGFFLVFKNWCWPIIPLEWIDYIFPVLVLVPYTTIVFFVYKLSRLSLSKRYLSYKLRFEVNKFNSKYREEKEA